MTGFAANDRLTASGGDMDNGRRETLTIGIGDDERDAGLDRRHQRVGRAEVDADYSAHASLRQKMRPLARILAVVSRLRASKLAG